MLCRRVCGGSVLALVLACSPSQPAPAVERVQVIERVQAVAADDSAPLAAAEAPSSQPATHTEQPNRRLCDRTYAADRTAPKVAWPAPGAKSVAPGPTWINLWAAWCKPCVEEIPELRAWAEEGGFALYFLSLDDDSREWKQGVDKLQLGELKAPFGSSWLGPGKARGQWLRQLGFQDIPNLPGQVLIDREKRLRCYRSGAIEPSEKAAFLAFMKAL